MQLDCKTTFLTQNFELNSIHDAQKKILGNYLDWAYSKVLPTL